MTLVHPTYGAAWRLVRDQFSDAQIITAELDARLLAQQAFDLDEVGLVVNEREPVAPAALQKLADFAKRRLTGEPVARILGYREFYGRHFGLNTATLVPRPETEKLVDLALDVLGAPADAKRILDLGTGSGCIAISILAELALTHATGVDISAEALEQARENAARHSVAKRMVTIKGSWFAPLSETEKFDLILSNPPYIDTKVVEELAPDVRLFDPMAALDGGADGLDAYREICVSAPRFLAPGGTVLVEIGFDQAVSVATLFKAAGFSSVNVFKDLAGLDRVISATLS